VYIILYVQFYLKGNRNGRVTNNTMQHIPLPQNPTIGYIEMPCLTDQEYDRGDLETFPARQGWARRTAVQWKALFENPTEDFIAFMQLWRYFGYIRSILEFATLQSLTSLTADGIRVVDTTDLATRTDNHIRATAGGYESPDADFISRLNRSTRLFRKLKTTVNPKISCETWTNESSSETISLYQFMITFKFTEPLSYEIINSIWLLHDFVTAIRENFPPALVSQQWPNSAGNDRNNCEYLPAMYNSGEIHQRRMLNSGWCPYRVRECGSRMTTTDLVHVANMQRPDNLNHWLCTYEACRFTSIDNADYQTQHATSYAGRSFVAANVEKMSVILETDSYPVIDMYGPITSEGTMCLSPVDRPGAATARIQYVAISHVWSDGLGNPHENSIPSCQLSKLGELVRNVPHTPHLGPYSSFWLDTICCPVQDGSNIQQMAIAKMKATYERASAVLVLDLSLLIRTTDTLSDAEILSRILCSRWTSRLWTFQEGALAQRLFIQFANGPYDLHLGLDELMTSVIPSIRLVAQRSIHNQVKHLLYRAPPPDQVRQLSTLANSVCYRDTSVLSDEPLCLANLLRLKTHRLSQISASDPQARMIAFWRLLSNVPLGFAFDGHPKLSQPGFQWAPKSLLQWRYPLMKSVNPAFHPGSAEIASMGLLFNAPVLPWIRIAGAKYPQISTSEPLEIDGSLCMPRMSSRTMAVVQDRY